MKQWQSIISHIEQTTGQPFSLERQQSMGGGSINAAFLLVGRNGQQYFVKTNQPGQLAMFEAEARGLQALASSRTLKVPQSVCFGENPMQSYIVLEYLDMSGRADQRILGEQLAAMHRVSAERFGWDIDNTIGATHQPNHWMSSWLDFWRDQRLGYQLQLAAKNGYGGQQLMESSSHFFDQYEPKPSLLHGDLWSGNWAGSDGGEPVIFDPASYYGDREADIAMTYVFGGFGPGFYASYQDAFPLDDGFTVRKTFYNIYHIINHLNMFGGGYHGQAMHMIEQVLPEVS